MAEISSMLRTVVEQHADLPALVAGELTLSWSETGDRVARLAAYLADEFPSPRGRIALTGPNSIDYLLAILAIIESGNVVCPISNRFPESEQARIAATLEAPILDTTQIDWPSVLRRTVRELSVTQEVERIATVIATSGSSGKPKFAALTLGNQYYSALGSQENISFQPGDRWLVSLPLYHVGGMALLFRALISGGTLVVLSPGESLSDAIREHGITHLSVVPTQLYRLLSPPADLSTLAKTLKVVLIGGAGASPALIDRALEAGLPIHTSYGLTEMSSQVTTTGRNEPAMRLFASGRLLKYRQLRIAADGEILVRGETRFAGYLTESGLSRPFDADGWFATGDIGSLDPAGYLTVQGRKDNMFVSGGENIHPEQIESALCRLPEVREAVVVAIADDEFGHRPAAFVRLEARTPFDEIRLIKFLERLLPRFKIPDEFFPWPDDAPVDALKPDRKWFARRAGDILNR